MDTSAYIQASECLKVLAHPKRLRLVALLRAGSMSVGDIALALGLQSHVTSEHLRLMQHCGFLVRQRQGRKVCYEIAEPHLLELLSCIESRFSSHEKSDKKRLKGVNK